VVDDWTWTSLWEIVWEVLLSLWSVGSWQWNFPLVLPELFSCHSLWFYSIGEQVGFPPEEVKRRLEFLSGLGVFSAAKSFIKFMPHDISTRNGFADKLANFSILDSDIWGCKSPIKCSIPWCDFLLPDLISNRIQRQFEILTPLALVICMVTIQN